MAEHYENLAHDARCSIIVSETQGEGDRLATARATFVGKSLACDKSPELKKRFLAKHPGAQCACSSFLSKKNKQMLTLRVKDVHFDDFVAYKFIPESVRYIGGFGEMSWVAGSDVAAPPPRAPPPGSHYRRPAIRFCHQAHERGPRRCQVRAPTHAQYMQQLTTRLLQSEHVRAFPLVTFGADASACVRIV